MAKAHGGPKDGLLVLRMRNQVDSLLRAAEALGGAHALAQHLGHDVAVLIEWMKGAASLPPSIFLKVVKLLEGDGRTLPPMASTRASPLKAHP